MTEHNTSTDQYATQGVVHEIRETLAALARLRLRFVSPRVARLLAGVVIGTTVLFGVSSPASAVNATVYAVVADSSLVNGTGPEDDEGKEPQERFEEITEKPISTVAGKVVRAVTERRDAAERRAFFHQRVLDTVAHLEWVESQRFIWPVAGTFTSEFGMRWGAMHQGVDISAPVGTPIWASRPGTVVSAAYDGGYGNSIVIDHGDGMKTRYAHNQTNLVSSGQYVTRGQVIGTVGSTGDSSGPHVHFEIHIGSTPQNPRAHIQ